MPSWGVWLIIGIIALVVIGILWVVANKRGKTVNEDYNRNIEVCRQNFQRGSMPLQKCLSDAMRNQREGRTTAAAANASTTGSALMGLGEAGFAGWAFTH